MTHPDLVEVAVDEVTLLLAPLLERGVIVYDRRYGSGFEFIATIGCRRYIGRGPDALQGAAALLDACSRETRLTQP